MDVLKFSLEEDIERTGESVLQKVDNKRKFSESRTWVWWTVVAVSHGLTGSSR